MQRILITLTLLVIPFIASAQQTDVRFEVVSGGERLLHRETPACKDIKYGFEGGRILKVGDTYHWITTELVGDPRWVKVRIAHWTSENGTDWQRKSTIQEGDGALTGKSQRSSLWGPMMVFVEDEDRWHLVYVCYKGTPKMIGYFGVIQHAVSDISGLEGIGGPYTDKGILLRCENDKPDPWEVGESGLSQGVDSFFPYKIGNKWYAFYGSATISPEPECKYGNWKVGLASADKIAGPWARMTKQNPVDLKSNAENPIVFQLDNGTYIAIIDGVGDGMRYALSQDGVKWSESRLFEMEPTVKKWWSDLRTPLSLIKESDGTYTMYFTALDVAGFGTLSKVKLEMLQ